MSMKPRLEEDNKGIPNLATHPQCYPTTEESVVIPNTCTSKKSVPNSRLTPNAATAPKTFGN
jgi:hypothetical protein